MLVKFLDYFTSPWLEELQNCFTDLTFRCGLDGGDSVRAHSKFLEQHSGVVRKLVQNTRGCCSCRHREDKCDKNEALADQVIIMPDFSAKEVKKWIQLCYSGQTVISSVKEMTKIKSLFDALDVQTNFTKTAVGKKKGQKIWYPPVNTTNKTASEIVEIPNPTMPNVIRLARKITIQKSVNPPSISSASNFVVLSKNSSSGSNGVTMVNARTKSNTPNIPNLPNFEFSSLGSSTVQSSPVSRPSNSLMGLQIRSSMSNAFNAGTSHLEPLNIGQPEPHNLNTVTVDTFTGPVITSLVGNEAEIQDPLEVSTPPTSKATDKSSNQISVVNSALDDDHDPLGEDVLDEFETSAVADASTFGILKDTTPKKYEIIRCPNIVTSYRKREGTTSANKNYPKKLKISSKLPSSKSSEDSEMNLLNESESMNNQNTSLDNSDEEKISPSKRFGRSYLVKCPTCSKEYKRGKFREHIVCHLPKDFLDKFVDEKLQSCSMCTFKGRMINDTRRHIALSHCVLEQCASEEEIAILKSFRIFRELK